MPDVVSRIERLPFSSWHIRLVGFVGFAHLMDAFDSLTIALVLPVLGPLWHLTPGQIGLLISAGYMGQLAGGIILSWIAERTGRLNALRIALGLMGAFGFFSALAWGYSSFLVLRMMQGLGLGGEVPVAATLVTELTPARLRGRMTGSLQCLFGGGLLLTSAVAAWAIPRFGWQSMFYVGSLPLALMCTIGRYVPESPRWLILRGRNKEAEASLSRIEDLISAERPLPAAKATSHQLVHESGNVKELFSPAYRQRTIAVWALMFCSSTVVYTLISWMPTIYRTIYGYALQDVFFFSTLGGTAALAGTIFGVFLVDRAGRRPTFMIGLLGCVLPLAALTVFDAKVMVVSLVCMSQFTTGMVFGCLHTYATEIYPTRLRAVGAGTAIAWLRIASIVVPIFVGFLLGKMGVTSVYIFITLASAIGGTVAATAIIETKGRALEEISV